MKHTKLEWIRFFLWLRNGFCFCTTWFLILILGWHFICGKPMVSAAFLTQMLVFAFGGVLIFNLFFTRLLIAKWTFEKRLLFFMISVGIYESIWFYQLGIFSKKGTAVRWFVFVGIVLMLYGICMIGYRSYSKKQGELYTQALQKYQTQTRKKSAE